MKGNMLRKKEFNLYDFIRNALGDDPSLRDSDKKLMWRVWQEQGLATSSYITYEQFIAAELPENVRRTRQKVQEDHKELASSKSVAFARKRKEKLKGMFVYHNKIPVFNYDTNTVIFKENVAE